MSLGLNQFVFIFLASSLAMCVGCKDDAKGKNSVGTTTAELVQQSQPRVGLVDMQRLSESLGISNQLDQKRQKLQQAWQRVDIDTRKKFESTLEGFGGDPAKLTEDQKAELQKLQLDRNRKLAQVEKENTTAMQETSRWLRRVLAEKTKGPISAVGNDLGFDLILIRSAGQVAFARAGVDVTDKVLQRAGLSVGAGNGEGQRIDASTEQKEETSN